MAERSNASLRDLCVYFLKLGTFGFGGPIVLTGHMRRDLVDEKGWITKDDFAEGMALSQLAPGPLAAQMAIYIGWLKGRTLGATVVGVAFVIPSFIMVLLLSWLYVHFGGLSWIQGAFYGIGACVIAIIAMSAYKLVKKTFEKDLLLWGIGLVSAAVTLWTESEILWVFLLAGVLAILIKAPPRLSGATSAFVFPPLMLTGINGPVENGVLSDLFWFFTKAGAFVFGSGLAIVPFLHSGVVGEHAWLTERQFVDAVAVAMITPGPVVITVAFIGFLVAGFLGALVAAAGVFFPCYLFTVIPAPYFRKFARNPRIKAFVDGVTAAAIGAIAGAAVIIGRKAITDWFTAVIAILTLVALLKLKKLPEPVLILIAGGLGIAATYI